VSIPLDSTNVDESKVKVVRTVSSEVDNLVEVELKEDATAVMEPTRSNVYMNVLD
jgi:hypothetical protein